MKDKWQTLIHNGPIFPKPYDYKGFDANLSSLSEEMLYHYAAKSQTDYVKNSTFNKNFWKDLRPTLPLEYQSRKFPEDFSTLISEIYSFIQLKKEEKKLDTKEDKAIKLAEKEALKEKYGFCILNGEKQPLASPMIEGPGIFIPRGQHPMLGLWKPRTRPEDVTINATNGNEILPPEGRTWKAVIEHKGSMELVTYNVVLSSGAVMCKRILFAATSIVKQSSDQKKFEKAIVLLKNWKKIQKHIDKNISSTNPIIKQSALVSYLIMNLGIRVGDEKGEDAADTVGASSLRKEHLNLEECTLKLNFLGKDSVEYKNEITLPANIAEEFNSLLNSVETGEMIFPKVSSSVITNFLSEVTSGVTAKVFRTAHASSLLARCLKNSVVDSSMSLTEKLAVFNNANFEVAKKLNHQRNVGKSAEKNIELKEKLDTLISTLEKANKVFKKEMKSCSDDKAEKLQKKIDRNNQRIKEFQLKYSFKEKTANVALGTSRTNYCDPRIVASWCNDFDIPLDKIYNKAMQAKFSWALNVNSNYYKDYKDTK